MIKLNKIVIGILLCIPMLLPYFSSNFFHLHDFTHVARLSELESAINEGQFPVRWSKNLGFGRGMPQFSFYGPLFYYEAYIFKLVGCSAVWAVKLTVVLQVLVSFIALYSFGKIFFGPWGGLLAGIAGIYSPYRALDMYVRGAFGELTAMTFIALALWGLARFTQKPSREKILFPAVAIAGIVISHNLTALISTGFLLIIGLVFLWHFSQWNVRSISMLMLVLILAGLLSAFYAMPAFLEKDLTQANTLTGGFSNYQLHFLYLRQFWNSKWGFGGSIWGLEDGISFELGKIQIVTALLCLVGFIARFVKTRKITKNEVLWVSIYALLAASLLFTTFKTKFIWDLLPFMAYIQFPWRFLTISILLLAMATGFICNLVPKKLVPLVSLGICLLIVISQISKFKPESYLTNDDALYYTDSVRIQKEMSGIIPDFLPINANFTNLSVPIGDDSRFSTSTESIESIVVNRGHEFTIKLKPHPNASFTAQIFDFPEWRLFLDGKKIDHTMNNDGLITVTLPATDHYSYLSGHLFDTTIRVCANILTIIGVIFSGIILILSKKEKQKHG